MGDYYFINRGPDYLSTSLMNGYKRNKDHKLPQFWGKKSSLNDSNNRMPGSERREGKREGAGRNSWHFLKNIL